MTFQEWVEKHQIGPGMNDNNPHVKEFVENLAGEPNMLQVSSQQSLKNMAKKLYSGFDGSVGPGWIGILDRLATDLIDMGWDRDLHQVKEKFGGLRFYIGASTPEMQGRIEAAEKESYCTCEDCGAPGKAEGPGWIKTLCTGCRTKRNEARGFVR